MQHNTDNDRDAEPAFVCGGPVCRCSGNGDECSCVPAGNACRNCGRSVMEVDPATGRPRASAVPVGQESLF